MKSHHLFLSVLLATFLCSSAPVYAESAKITSDKMLVDKETNIMKLLGNVFALRQATGGTLRAEELELTRSKETDQLTYGKAEGKVVLHEELDIVLCEYLNFDDSSKIAILQGDVFVTTGEIFLKGHKLRYNYEEEKGRLYAKSQGETEASFYREKPDKNGNRMPINAWAKEIIINRPLGKLTLQGGVRILDESDGSTMNAERMDVYLNKDESLKEIVADGNFQMEQPGRSAKSNRAILDYITEIITLTGNAYLKEVGEAAVQSQRIEMHMDSEKGMLKGEDKKQVTVELEF
ncbi:MAG: LptA/OstA family protein [SAR324 cluster bacterium]|nr:LptA/OstA family protein [SAR324 cluster bacterium]